MSKDTNKLRIHGDNILECENTLKLIATSLNGGAYKLISGSAYAPIYSLTSNAGEKFEIQLFAGYGRWDFPLAEYVASLGGMLREAPDAIVTRVETAEGKQFEDPVLSLEFSGALPAGNNAWQRTGRALALAYAGIPYLYFAELGGQELSATRTLKASRFPNPLVPFAYAVLGVNSGTPSLPIYAPSPSSSKRVVKVFEDCFGTNESVEFVKGTLLSENNDEVKKELEQKVINALEILAQQRKRKDILEPKEWRELYNQKTGVEKAEWLTNKAMPWNKKTGIKSLTPTFKELIEVAKNSGAVAIGSKEMPICLIPAEKRKDFVTNLKKLYGPKIDSAFTDWAESDSRPMLCVWIAGFKPRGDDSRPDRGLAPLARMIFGIENIDLLAVVYGPAKPNTWNSLQKDMHELAKVNGLWESIVNLSDGIIVDSNTSTHLDKVGFVVEKGTKSFRSKILPAASTTPSFGEHDIDSVLHLLFSHESVEKDVFECMCNPPGGDWSGIGLRNLEEDTELRWTSLPRVSGSDSKRPDHLIQVLADKTLISIESKDTAAKLETGIGPRLTKYVNTLFGSPATASKKLGSDEWQQYSGDKTDGYKIISAGAFKYVNEKNLKETLGRSKTDIAIGVEFISDQEKTILHVTTNSEGATYIKLIRNLAQKLSDFIEVEEH